MGEHTKKILTQIIKKFVADGNKNPETIHVDRQDWESARKEIWSEDYKVPGNTDFRKPDWMKADCFRLGDTWVYPK